MTPTREITWDPVERWLREKRPTTRRIYEIYMNRFLESAGKRLGFSDENGFLSWAMRQGEGIAVPEAMESFGQTQSETVRATALSALKTFLERNGYRYLPKGLVPRPWEGEFISGYTRQQIIQLLGYLDDPLQKLFVMFQKDNGFRARTTLCLKWHHVRPDYDKALSYCHLYLENKYYKGKKSAGISFIGPDSLWLLKDLVTRGRVQVNKEECDTTLPDEKRWKCECKPIFPFAYHAILNAIILAKKKAGLPKKIQPTHGLRKFFENSLDKCEPSLDKDKKNQLEGHSIGVRRRYTEQVETLRPLYERAYPHLTLSEDAVADQKMKALLDQVKTLKDQSAGYGDLKLQVDRLTLQQERLMRILEEKFGRTSFSTRGF